jgi:hypothetical protein
LGSEEHSNLIHEKIEKVRCKFTREFWVELSDEDVNVEEGFNSLRKHLIFNFVKDHIGFVFPVHGVTDLFIIY